MAILPLRDVPPDDEFPRTMTLAGSEVRIYARETGEFGRIHGAYWANGNWHLASWQRSGHFHPVSPSDGTQYTCGLDLIEAK